VFVQKFSRSGVHNNDLHELKNTITYISTFWSAGFCFNRLPHLQASGISGAPAHVSGGPSANNLRTTWPVFTQFRTFHITGGHPTFKRLNSLTYTNMAVVRTCEVGVLYGERSSKNVKLCLKSCKPSEIYEYIRFSVRGTTDEKIWLGTEMWC
jgi:hypothetical protein